MKVQSYIHEINGIRILINYVGGSGPLDITAWDEEGNTLSMTKHDATQVMFENLKDPDHEIIQAAVNRLKEGDIGTQEK